MSRLNATLLGIGLTILCVVGLAQGATQWLTWMVGVIALASFGVAAFVPTDLPEERRMVPPIALALALFGLWIVGLATRSTDWFVWLTFVAGCAYVLNAVTVVGQERPTLREA